MVSSVPSEGWFSDWNPAFFLLIIWERASYTGPIFVLVLTAAECTVVDSGEIG